MRQFIVVLLLAIMHFGCGCGDLSCKCGGDKSKPTDPKKPEPKKLSTFVVGA
jgi:hypothetical protein